MSGRFGVRQVVSGQQLPTRLPITGTLVVGLLLDRLQAPGWLCGAAGVLAVLFWAIVIYCRRHETQVRLRCLERDASDTAVVR